MTLHLPLNRSRFFVSGEAVATRTVKAAERESIFLFDRAAGIVYTLPAPSASLLGMHFDFHVLTSITSNSAKVITTPVATVFLTGSLINIDTDSSNAVAAWTGDGTSHVAVTMNGTTTGGLRGTRLRFTLVSTTLWLVEGVVHGSGTVATPFATS